MTEAFSWPLDDLLPLSGAGLLDEVLATFCKYVAFPSSQAADASVLWTAATHGVQAWQHAPRLVARSATKRSGKSRLMDVVAETCHKPLMTVNASTAAVFRSIGDDPPTLLVDEADTIFGSKKVAENNEELRGLLNAGHQRGRTSLRCVGPLQTPTEFPTFAMAMLAGIGAMPDTIEDRAVVVRMRRRAPEEKVDAYRTRRDQPGLNRLRDQLAEWVGEHLEHLADAEPDMPLEDRAADTREPLVAIADLAGGIWPTRARAAALYLVAEHDEAEAAVSESVRLLHDVAAVFDGLVNKSGYLPTKILLAELRDIEDAPWSELDLTARRLAMRLREFGIRPRHRDRQKSERGYHLADFADPLRRYQLPDENDPPSHPSATVQPVRTISDLHEHADGTQDCGRVEPSARHQPSARNRRSTGMRTGADGCGQMDGGDDHLLAFAGRCSVCDEPFVAYEPGQTAHPCCAPPAASTAEGRT